MHIAPALKDEESISSLHILWQMVPLFATWGAYYKGLEQRFKKKNSK